MANQDQWTLERCRALLQDQRPGQDMHDKAYAASGVFEAWYEIAKKYAKGELEGGKDEMDLKTLETLQLLFLVGLPGNYFIQPSADTYVIRNLLDGIERITDIFTRKPKFTAILVEEPVAQKSLHWLGQEGAPRLLQAATCDATIQAILTLAFELTREHHNVMTSPWIALDVSALVVLGAKVDLDSMLRTAALDCLQVIAETREAVVVSAFRCPSEALVQRAADRLALERLLLLGGLKNPKTTTALLTNIKRAQRDKNRAFIFNLLEALYHAMLNNQTGFTTLANSVIEKTGIKLQSLFNPTEQLPAIYEVIELCDMEDRLDPELEEDNSERPEHLLNIWEFLSNAFPEEERLVQFALARPTVKSLSRIESIAAVYPEKIWINILLTFVRDELDKMPLSVTGLQRDQHVIYLLRECCRIFYISQENLPSPDLGRNVFVTLLRAIQHGYYTTEGFCDIGSEIVCYHYAAGHPAAINWLALTLSPLLARDRKTQNALSDMLMTLLGLESSSFGVGALSSFRPKDEFFLEDVCVALAIAHSNARDEFWTSLFTVYYDFLRRQRRAVDVLLRSIEAELDSMIASAQYDLERLESLANLVSAITAHPSPDRSSTLFEVTLKLANIHPEGETLRFDYMLAHIVENVTRRDELPFSKLAIENALRTAGLHTRCELARLVPHMCLLDPDPDVRICAMETMECNPELLPLYAPRILESCMKTHSTGRVRSEDDSERIGLSNQTLALTAASLLGEVAVRHPPALVPATMYLVSSAEGCARNNDSLNEVPKVFISSFRRIAKDGSRKELRRLLLTDEGLHALPFLMSLASEWGYLAEQMAQDGLLQETDDLVQSVVPGRLRTRRFYRTAAGDTALMDVDILDVGSQQSVDAANEFNLLLDLYQRDDLVGAVNVACHLQTAAAALFNSNHVREIVEEQLVPKVVHKLLPEPEWGPDHCPLFKADDLAQYDRWQTLFKQLKVLCGPEAAASFCCGERLLDLQLALVVQLLSRNLQSGGVDIARQFIRKNDIRSPVIFGLLERIGDDPKRAMASIREYLANYRAARDQMEERKIRYDTVRPAGQLPFCDQTGEHPSPPSADKPWLESKTSPWKILADRTGLSSERNVSAQAPYTLPLVPQAAAVPALPIAVPITMGGLPLTIESIQALEEEDSNLQREEGKDERQSLLRRRRTTDKKRH